MPASRSPASPEVTMRHPALLAFAGALLASIVTLAPPLSAQALGQRSREQIKASYDAHQGDFDYLLGDWEFTSRSEEHTSELQSLAYLVCRLLLEKKKKQD